MYNEKMYFRDDLVKEYAAKRKGLEVRDIEDLLNCLVKYLEKDSKREEHYAYFIPNIGMLHKKLDFGLKETNEGLFHEMLIDVFTNGDKQRLKKKEKVTEEQKEAYQKWQNGA